jgi:hypothetical protein
MQSWKNDSEDIKRKLLREQEERKELKKEMTSMKNEMTQEMKKEISSMKDLLVQEIKNSMS